jgi:hypothetical protein
MIARGSQHNIQQINPLENRLLLYSYAQFLKVSGIYIYIYIYIYSLAHADPFVASFFRSTPVRSSVVNLLIYLVD